MTLRSPFSFFSDEDAMEDDFFSLGRDYSSSDEDDEDDDDFDEEDEYDDEDDDDFDM